MADTATTALTVVAAAAATTTFLTSKITPSYTSFATTPTPPVTSPPNDEESTGECQLLGPFAVLVQAALGVLALSSLVFKRWRERPQRPVKIWAFDASKQVFGSGLLHLANLLMAMFSAGQIQSNLAKVAASTVGVETTDVYQPNPCSFYLLNLAIDTTIGIPILIVILKVFTVGASYTPIARPPESIKSGHYGDPPNALWWLKQSFIYFLGLLGMKTCVFFIFQLCPWLGEVGDWALRWTEGNEAIQIAFVMLIFPLIMNAIQYYIIDTFIKSKTLQDELEQEESPGNESERGELLAEEEEERLNRGHSVDDPDEPSPKTSRKESKPGRVRAIEVDPDKEGTFNTSIAESSSSTSNVEDEDFQEQPRK